MDGKGRVAALVVGLEALARGKAYDWLGSTQPTVVMMGRVKLVVEYLKFQRKEKKKSMKKMLGYTHAHLSFLREEVFCPCAIFLSPLLFLVAVRIS